MGGLTDIDGVKVGVASSREGITGVTVVLVEKGAPAAVEVRGAAPGTRETDLLGPGQMIRSVQAVVLAGGSAYGLDAASGVMRYLEEKHCGFCAGNIVVPIVPAAVLFDLSIGNGGIRPDAEMGYRACVSANDGPVPSGSVGAGTGATVAKINGIKNAIKSGQGSAAVNRGNLIVAALMVVNAFGDVYSEDGSILAGPLNRETGKMESTIDLLSGSNTGPFEGNTTLGVIVTNAELDRDGLSRVCKLAHDGLARTVWPVHTMWDGDTIFALSCGSISADVNQVGLIAAEATARAVRSAVNEAVSLGGIISVNELR